MTHRVSLQSLDRAVEPYSGRGSATIVSALGRSSTDSIPTFMRLNGVRASGVGGCSRLHDPSILARARAGLRPAANAQIARLAGQGAVAAGIPEVAAGRIARLCAEPSLAAAREAIEQVAAAVASAGAPAARVRRAVAR